MNLEDAKRQKSGQLELRLEYRGETPTGQPSGGVPTVENGNGDSGSRRLMEEVVARANVRRALERVKKNGGSPGVDGMTVGELPKHLWDHWEDIREQLLAGTYQPQPVKRQEIPKRGGGIRQLGIPSALDRFIQQAILQVLQPRFDPTFSEHSHGFRPGRRAHDAIREAQRYIQEGRRWVVDVDLEKFFDRVNHDVLMGRLAKRIADKRLLGLIRRYLEAGIMVHGVVIERHEGTPQGGPLSPLLANMLLDEVDKELEKRGLAFVRYADDCNVYVRSQRAAERAMKTLRRLYGKLRLRVNESKSATARPWNRKILGYSFWVAPGRIVKRRVAPEALDTMKARVREITNRNGGRSIRSVIEELKSYLRGWREYFRLADTPKILTDLDQWVRFRVRMVQLKQWKRGRTVFRKLRARGVPENAAASAAAHARRWCRTAKHPGLSLVMPISFFDRCGIPRLGA